MKTSKAFWKFHTQHTNKGPDGKADAVQTVKNFLIPEAETETRSISGDGGVWTKRKLKSTKQRAWDQMGSTKTLSHKVIMHSKTQVYTAQSQPTIAFTSLAEFDQVS